MELTEKAAGEEREKFFREIIVFHEPFELR
jgi:hypothetical protein